MKFIKEPDNQYDKEAISVERDGLSQIGFVANSTITVQGDSCSDGRTHL